MFNRSRIILFEIIFTALFLGACSFDAKYRGKSLQAPIQEVKLDSQSMPGDKISITFMRNLHDTTMQNYQLQRGDDIQISVQDREDLSRLCTIGPDGNIYFPYLEPILAIGKTLKELLKITEEKYQPTVKSARITLIPVHFAGKIEALLSGLANPNGRGSNYETIIGADGLGVFPQIGFIKIAGLSLQEINSTLQAHYVEVTPGIEVTANLIAGSSKYLTLLGEVKHPGSFNIPGPLPLTAALGLAEGWLPSAHLEDIILVQRRNGKVTISKYNLEIDLMVAAQLQLIGGDLVFVPRSAITDLNIFVDQYLKRNLPFNVGVSVPVPFLQNP